METSAAKNHRPISQVLSPPNPTKLSARGKRYISASSFAPILPALLHCFGGCSLILAGCRRWRWPWWRHWWGQRWARSRTTPWRYFWTGASRLLSLTAATRLPQQNPPGNKAHVISAPFVCLNPPQRLIIFKNKLVPAPDFTANSLFLCPGPHYLAVGGGNREANVGGHYHGQGWSQFDAETAAGDGKKKKKRVMNVCKHAG